MRQVFCSEELPELFIEQIRKAFEGVTLRKTRVCGWATSREVVEAIAQTQMDPRHAHLDEIIKDWNP